MINIVKNGTCVLVYGTELRTGDLLPSMNHIYIDEFLLDAALHCRCTRSIRRHGPLSCPRSGLVGFGRRGLAFPASGQAVCDKPLR